MWVLCAFGSAFFVEITSILAKCGIKKTDSHVVKALRTIVVLFFSWLMVLVGGSHQSLSSISTRTWFFLIVSGFQQELHGFVTTRHYKWDQQVWLFQLIN